MAGFGGFGNMFRGSFGGGRGRGGMPGMGGSPYGGVPGQQSFGARSVAENPWGRGQQGMGNMDWAQILGGVGGGVANWLGGRADRNMEMDQFNQRQAFAEQQYADAEERKRLHREALARQSRERQGG